MGGHIEGNKHNYTNYKFEAETASIFQMLNKAM